jgi:hypothetical protein
VGWYTPVTPSLRRLREEDHEAQSSLGYIVGCCIKKKKKNLFFMILKWLSGPPEVSSASTYPWAICDQAGGVLALSTGFPLLY